MPVSNLIAGMNYFRNIKINGVTEESYKDIDSLIESVKAFARLSSKSVYIMDLYKQNFIFVSENPLFFSGYTAEEIRELGFDFFIKSTKKEDLAKISEINDRTIELIHSLPIEDRTKLILVDTYSTINKQTQKELLLCHQSTPLRLSSTGEAWLILCVESIASAGTKQEIIAYTENPNKIWKYDESDKQWQSLEWLKLKEVEKDILRLSAMGLSMKEIATELGCSYDTIKFYRKELLKKFGAKNIIEAYNTALIYRMI